MTNPFEENIIPRIKKPSLFSRLRGAFLTGLVVIAPIGMTVFLIWTIFGWVDTWVLTVLPASYHPETIINSLLGYEGEKEELTIDLRIVSAVVFLIFTTLIGWMAKGLVGRSILRLAERLVNRTPIVRSIYNGIKQIAETVFAQQDTSFDQACLIEYPRKGIWAVGFVSTETKGEVAKIGNDGKGMLSVFVPTTPNPTSGFLLFFPKEDVKILDMSVEDAAKLVISAGLVYPAHQDGAPESALGDSSNVDEPTPAP